MIYQAFPFLFPMILQDVQGKMLTFIWASKQAWQKEKKRALPVPPGRVYPQCLGNASCSPRQGAGGSNTRTK